MNVRRNQRVKTFALFLCGGRSLARRKPQKMCECFGRRAGKKETLESWPTSPVLMEEKNARQKEKAHKYYERQLKACSWYTEKTQHTWIEVVEPYEGNDLCSECRYEEPCGCVLVSNRPLSYGERKRCATNESWRSSLYVPRADSRASRLSSASRISRVSRNSRTSGEDDKSYYDNLCPSCKSGTLERRARKYGEWRRRWSSKMAAEIGSEEEPLRCTCTIDNYSFPEWKNLYEQDELLKFSRVHRPEEVSTSDYGTHRTDKSKHSEYTTTIGRDSTLGSNVKSASIGYNTDQNLDSSDSSYSPLEVSDASESSSDEVDLDLFEEELAWIHKVDCALEQRKRCKPNKNAERTKTRPCRTRKIQTKATVSTIPLQIRPLDSEGNTSSSEGNTYYIDTIVLPPGSSTPSSEGVPLHYEDAPILYEGVPIPSETVLSSIKGRRADYEDDGIPVICVTPTDYIAPKHPTENDETLPADPFSEFVEVAKSIDKFYESIHAKQFMKNRAASTSTAHDSADDLSTGNETFSLELKKRIQSLERLCSFVDHSDEDEFECENASRKSPFPEENEKTVWRLSQQSINNTLSRRSRSNTSSSSNPSRSTSTSGSAPNSRSSTRQGHYKIGKCPVASVENICSPDSGFCEKTNSFPALNSPEACPLGTKWAGSMQWDYTDWTYYFGCDCGNSAEPVFVDENVLTINDASLTTIHEAPPTSPQDPLDWDF